MKGKFTWILLFGMLVLVVGCGRDGKESDELLDAFLAGEIPAFYGDTGESSFVCDNTMELEHIKDNAYDLVYTSNGTLSWIDDLTGMYQNINRVLKNAGYSFMYDVHPFNRPFSGEAWNEPKIIKSYHDVMPDIHWRVQDIVNANIMAGLSINELAELPAVDASFWFRHDELIKKSQDELVNINDWTKNPMSALPAWMVLVSKKVSVE